MVPRRGIEPRTRGFSICSSTDSCVCLRYLQRNNHCFSVETSPHSVLADQIEQTTQIVLYPSGRPEPSDA